MDDKPKRLALVDITGATETHCGECSLLRQDPHGNGYCPAHRYNNGVESTVEIDEVAGDFLRLPQCLAAEREAKRMQRIEEVARESLARVGRDCDCGDNSCSFSANKTGMRTNGGCRCLRDGMTAKGRNAMTVMVIALKEALK